MQTCMVFDDGGEEIGLGRRVVRLPPVRQDRLHVLAAHVRRIGHHDGVLAGEVLGLAQHLFGAFSQVRTGQSVRVEGFRLRLGNCQCLGVGADE